MTVTSAASQFARLVISAVVVASLVATCTSGGTTGGGGGGGGTGGGGGGDRTTPTARPSAVSYLPKLISEIGKVYTRVDADIQRGYDEQQKGNPGPVLDSMRDGYLEVQTEINGWIVEYQNAVLLDQDVSDTYPTLRKAYSAADVFLDWLKQWHDYNTRPRGAAAAPKWSGANAAPVQELIEKFAVALIPVVTDAGIKVWEEMRKTDQEEQAAARQRVVDALEEAKWPDWT